MIRYILVTSLCIVGLSEINCQKKFDGSFDFQTEKNKKYSLYIPSNYSNGDNAVLALHPLNTSRWNSRSWRDTLITFAENNHVLLICPDGGPDGKVDDNIDTAFTTALLDSVKKAYSFNPATLVAMGFSWGGRTAYTYGLNHSELFKGIIPIGAAIEGINLNAISQNSKNKNIYIIHGSQDAIQTRYYPALESLSQKGSCLMDTLLNGVAHTIDFMNRNEILSIAYKYVLENNCLISSSNSFTLSSINTFPNPVRKNECLFYNNTEELFDIIQISTGHKSTIRLIQGCNTISLESGMYILVSKNFKNIRKLIVI
ncbi:MAG: hypothetical protein HOP11_03230 [Saprospiraceae bacterium]|nr:hypothetical protein [Saprospiraceae bacterium]